MTRALALLAFVLAVHVLLFAFPADTDSPRVTWCGFGLEDSR